MPPGRSLDLNHIIYKPFTGDLTYDSTEAVPGRRPHRPLHHFVAVNYHDFLVV
jgi:hypothetical protein